MSSIDNLIEKFASSTVEEQEKNKEVSFVGQALSLDTEDDAAEIVKAITDCPGMTTLRLEGNTIGIPAAKAIGKALESQTHFQNALWKDMFTRRDKDEIPQALTHLSNGIMKANAKLVVLDLSDNAFGPRGLVGLQELFLSSSCFTLKELYLNNNGLGISGAKLLSASLCKCVELCCKNGTPMPLKVFVCGRNRLENEGAIQISKFLGQLGSLESVSMPQNGIYSPGVKALSEAFALNPKLKVLDLEDNTLTQEGAEYIANVLPSLKNLEVLNLCDCLVRTDGAIALAAALENSCSQIKKINLNSNEISIDGGEAIVDMMGKKAVLESLCLNGNNFGEDGCDLLKERMADLDKADLLGSLSEDEGDSYDEDEETDEGDEEDKISISDKNEGCSHKSPLHRSPLAKAELSEFILNPTPLVLQSLSNAQETFLSVLPSEPEVGDYIDLIFIISKAVTATDELARVAACKYADIFFPKAYAAVEDVKVFDNELLIGIGLIKGETKSVELGTDISGALTVLAHAVKQNYFEYSTIEVLKFFLSRPFERVRASVKTKHTLLPLLYQYEYHGYEEMGHGYADIGHHF